MTVIPIELPTGSGVQGQSPAGRALIASTFCSVLQWFDLSLAVAATGMIAGEVASYGSLLLNLPIVMQLFGAALFGEYGDRVGRRAALVGTMVLMSGASVLLGLAVQLGFHEVWLFFVVRCLQGLAIGGAWAGCVCLAMESAETRDTGRFAAWPQIGMPAGFLLAQAFLHFLSPWLGWAFLLSGGFGLLMAVTVRANTKETLAIADDVEADRIASPLLTVVRKDFLAILLVAVVRAVELGVFLLFMYLPFAAGAMRDETTSPDVRLGIWSACVVAVVAIPIVGGRSSRTGQVTAYIMGAFATAVWAILYAVVLYFNQPFLALLAIMLSGLAYAMLAGPQAAFVAESFRMPRRYSGASLGTQLGAVIVLLSAQTVERFLGDASHPEYFVAGLVLALSLLSALAALCLRWRERLHEGLALEILQQSLEVVLNTTKAATDLSIDTLKATTLIKGLSAQKLREILQRIPALITKSTPALPPPPSNDFGPKRNLNAWIDDPAPVADRLFHVRINVGAPTGSEAGSATFFEPDWRGVEEIDLIVALSSSKCRIEPPWEHLKLMRSGNSDMLTFNVTPRKAGDHEFTVRVYLAKQMFRLQSLSFTVRVGAHLQAMAGAP